MPPNKRSRSPETAPPDRQAVLKKVANAIVPPLKRFLLSELVAPFVVNSIWEQRILSLTAALQQNGAVILQLPEEDATAVRLLRAQLSAVLDVDAGLKSDAKAADSECGFVHAPVHGTSSGKRIFHIRMGSASPPRVHEDTARQAFQVLENASRVCLQAVCHGLGLDSADALLDRIPYQASRLSTSVLSCINYCGTEAGDCTGAPEHVDKGLLTVVATDSVIRDAGLYTVTDKTRFLDEQLGGHDVIVMSGMTLERLSGSLKACRHGVASPSAGVVKWAADQRSWRTALSFKLRAKADAILSSAGARGAGGSGEASGHTTMDQFYKEFNAHYRSINAGPEPSKNSDKVAKPATAAPSCPSGGRDHIVITFQDEDGSCINFKLRRTAKVSLCFDPYVKARFPGVPPPYLRFFFDGMGLYKHGGNQTPDSLGMEDGDVVNVLREQTGD